jgi:hypothetical protein
VSYKAKDGVCTRLTLVDHRLDVGVLEQNLEVLDLKAGPSLPSEPISLLSCTLSASRQIELTWKPRST